MAIQQIEYENKVALNEDTTVQDKYKCKADDMNEIKSVVNGNSYATPKVSSQVDTDYNINVLTTNNLLNNNLSINGAITVNSTSEALDMNTNALTSSWIPCKPNTTYILSGEYNRNRWQTKSNDGTITYAGQEGTTLTTNSTAKYLRVYYYYNNDGPISPTGKNVMLNEGSTALSYEPFIPNSINIDNEKYSDTINVGTSINDKNRVNILYSSNIFNNVFQQGGLDLGSTGGEQTSDIRIRSEYILVEPNTTYTISIGTSNLTHCGIGLYKSNKSYDSAHKINNGGWNTFPITFSTESDTQYIRVVFRYGDGNVITPNGDYKVQINKGYEKTYEQYVSSPSINIDGEEIYSKPVVLWTNPSPTSSFLPKNITLSSDKYNYLEVYFRTYTGQDSIKSVKVEKGQNITMDCAFSTGSGANVFLGTRQITYVNDTTLSVGTGRKLIQNGTFNYGDDNGWIIPIKVLGYK